MDFEVISAITQIVGAIAVVISIFYLAIQIKSNTKALKAQAGFDSTHSWAEVNELLVNCILNDSKFQNGQESRFTDIATKFYDPNAKPEDLTPTENVVLAFGHRAMFQKLEGQYYMYKHGFLEPKLWEQRRNWARSLVSLPIAKNWWEMEKQQSIYSPEFVEVVSGNKSFDTRLTGIYDMPDE